MIIDHVATVRLALCGVIASAHGKRSRFRGFSQKIMAASQRHFGECRFFSWARFARGPGESCALLREPPTLRLPIRAWAAGLFFLRNGNLTLRRPLPICLFDARHWNQG